MKLKNTSVFILGKAYSGSTILGNYLNTHPDIFYAGELGRLPFFRQKYGYYEHDASCLQCSVVGVECPVYSGDILKKLGAKDVTHAHSVLRKATGKNTIVDGSKYVDWLRVSTSNNTNQATKVILLSKSPSEYLKSCAYRGIAPLWQEANAWRDTYYDALRTTSRLGIPVLSIAHHNLQKRKEQTLLQICNFIGVDFNKKMLVANSKNLHAVGGNPAAYSDTLSKKILKQKNAELGQSEFDINPSRIKKIVLSAKHQREIQSIIFETPMMVDIANLLGYKAGDIL